MGLAGFSPARLEEEAITAQCSPGIRILPAIPLVDTCGLCFDAPTPSAQANFGIPQAKCSES